MSTYAYLNHNRIKWNVGIEQHVTGVAERSILHGVNTMFDSVTLIPLIGKKLRGNTSSHNK